MWLEIFECLKAIFVFVVKFLGCVGAVIFVMWLIGIIVFASYSSYDEAKDGIKKKRLHLKRMLSASDARCNELYRENKQLRAKLERTIKDRDHYKSECETHEFLCTLQKNNEITTIFTQTTNRP